MFFFFCLKSTVVHVFVARWCIQAGACRGQFNKTVASLIYKCGYCFRVWKQKLHLKRFMKFIPGGCVARVQMPGRRHDQRNNKAFLQGPDSGTLVCEELRPFPHEHTLYLASCGRGLERHWRAVSKQCGFSDRIHWYHVKSMPSQKYPDSYGRSVKSSWHFLEANADGIFVVSGAMISFNTFHSQ